MTLTSERKPISDPAGPTRSTPDGKPKTRSREWISWLGLLPYVLFVSVFLIIPVLVNVWATFRVDGAFSLDNIGRMFKPQYMSAFASTFNLAFQSALIGGIIGVILAWALVTAPKGSIIGKVAQSFSVVASQSGGVPLAFAFIAALGTQGVVTQVLANSTGWNLADDFKLSSAAGVTLVYLYFQIPLMAILMMPAFDTIRVQWREAAESLGATKFQFVRDIAVPILMPAALGSLLVLFANAFSAYATAFALANNGINLVPILIGFMISGNGLPDEGLAAALVTGMMVIVILAMTLNYLLTRRLRKWQ